MIKKENIYPIGIGTWKIDYENFENEIDALVHSYEIGQNYLSLSLLYNNGEVVRQLKSLVDRVGREKFFIATNIEPIVEKVTDIEKQLNQYLEILDIEFVDMIQLHSPLFSKIALSEVYKEIDRLVKLGKVKHVGISNCNLDQLKEVNNIVKIDFFEGVYNLECKIYEDNGVLDYCRQNDIVFLGYQPLRRNRTAKRNYPVLIELSKKYNKTQNQIILNWIVKEKNIMPLIKSTNVSRIDENINSLNFEMDREDYDKLNEFRSDEFDNVIVDWNGNGGVTIDQLANQFE